MNKLNEEWIKKHCINPEVPDRKDEEKVQQRDEAQMEFDDLRKDLLKRPKGKIR